MTEEFPAVRKKIMAHLTNNQLIQQYLNEKPKIKKGICFQSLNVINDYKTIPTKRYIMFPYISNRKRKLEWNRDTLAFEQKEDLINFCNQLKIQVNFVETNHGK